MNHLEDRIREVVSFMHDATAQGPLTSDADILDDVSAVVNYLKENHEDVRHRLSTNGPNALKYHKLVRSQTAFVLREMRKNLAAEEVNNANDSDSSDSRSDFIESPPKSPAPKPQALSDDSIRQKKPDRDTPSAVPILREDIKASREDVKRPPAPTEDAKTAKRRRFLETVLATVDKKASINVSSSEKRFNPSPPSETKLEHHVHGVDGLAHRLRQDVVFPLQHPRIVAALGGCPTEADCVDPARIYRHPGHFLLAGPSGIGKTFLTAAIAGSAEVPWFKISSTELISGISGESEANIRGLFEAARSHAPSLIVIDDLHLVSPQQENTQKEMERRILAQMCSCLDSIRSSQVVVLGITNKLESIDLAVRRRFSEVLLTPPNESGRKAILQGMTMDLANVSNNVSLMTQFLQHKRLGPLTYDRLAMLTAGFVGGDLESLVDQAWKGALRRVCGVINNGMAEQELLDQHQDMLRVEQHDFEKAVGEVIPCAKREGFATVPDTRWEDVGGLEQLRNDLEEIICDPIMYPDLYRSANMDQCEGVLLYGPPGCGKTLVARAVANESNANFILVNGPELLNKYVGESERAVRETFRRAEAAAPCLVFFDEFDALCPSRQNDEGSGSGTRVVNTLLTELSGVHQRKQLYVLAATNRPDMIDPAILRSGRLEKRIYVPPPTLEDRAKILVATARKYPVAAGVSWESLAEKTENFTGADLAALVKTATRIAMRSGKAELLRDGGCPAGFVRHAHFLEALSVVSPTVTRDQFAHYEAIRNRLEGN